MILIKDISCGGGVFVFICVSVCVRVRVSFISRVRLTPGVCVCVFGVCARVLPNSPYRQFNW